MRGTRSTHGGWSGRGPDDGARGARGAMMVKGWIAGAVIALAALVGGCGAGDRADPAATVTRTHSAPAPSASRARPEPAPAPGAQWSYRLLVRRLAGRSLAMPHGRVRVDPALLICSGRGRPVSRGGARRWSRYTCTQTTFRHGVDRDVTFDIRILGPRRLKITSRRYGPA
jgi:hypothetical protein